MTYKLYTDGPGFVLVDPANPRHAFPIPDAQHLIQLNARINGYLTTATADGPTTVHPGGKELALIDTATARKLAAEQGLRVPNSTIVYASQHKKIAGAQKIGGRYKFPKWAFMEWLESWQSERARLRVDERGQE